MTEILINIGCLGVGLFALVLFIGWAVESFGRRKDGGA